MEMSSSWTDVGEDSPSEVPDELQVRRQCRQLLLEITELCKRSDHKSGQNVLLVGISGSGKSAFINTVFKALTGKYYPRADTGRGLAASKTLALGWYPHCGVTKDDLPQGVDGDILYEVRNRLPTLIDAAGMQDEQNDETEEILKLLIGGHIPPGTNLQQLMDIQKAQGLGQLPEICKEQCSDWMIDKIVFVQSCRALIPRNLIECLQKVLAATDSNTGQMLFDVKPFVLMTMYDTVVKEIPTEDGVQEVTSRDHVNRWISFEDFAGKEKSLAKLFSIEGQTDFSMRRFRSYCQELGYDSPYIDKDTLDFLKLLVLPGKPRVQHKHPLLKLPDIKPRPSAKRPSAEPQPKASSQSSMGPVWRWRPTNCELIGIAVAILVLAWVVSLFMREARATYSHNRYSRSSSQRAYDF